MEGWAERGISFEVGQAAQVWVGEKSLATFSLWALAYPGCHAEAFRAARRCCFDLRILNREATEADFS
jgi:hypothetical protein